MKKDMTIHDKKSALLKAQKELASFKKNKAINNNDSKQGACSAPSTKPEKELWCHDKKGNLSLLEFEITADKAIASKATALKQMASNGDMNLSSTQPDKTSLFSRQFSISPHYKGCPHCGNQSFVHCTTCGELSCWPRGKDGWHICPACDIGGRVMTRSFDISFENQTQKPTPPLSKSNKPQLPKAKTQKTLPKPKRPLLPFKK